MLVFSDRWRTRDLIRRNVRQKLIANPSYMTGFDEWMCMPAFGTGLAPAM
jgi:hypothetical protein